MTDTPLAGQLEDYPFAEVAGRIFRGRKTGILTVTSPKKKRQVAFYEGHPVAVLPGDGKEHIARFLAKRGEGMHHICLEVDDMQTAMTQMAASGLQVLEEKPRMGSQGQKYIFIHPKTAHGVLIELYERAK